MVYNVTCQSIIYCVYFNIFCRRYLRFRYAIMILRLVYSFFFFSLVTGNQRLDDSTQTARTGDCQNKICVCQDQADLGTVLPHASPLSSVHLQVLPKITESPLRVVEKIHLGHYGYPAHGMISANPVHSAIPQTRIETKSYDMEFVSDEGPRHQVPRQVQYVEEDTEYTEKTICFTPSMVHKMIKAALEYVSQMPSDINNIIDKLDQELNRMSDHEAIEENAVKKPLYPLDSKTIFQMLNKPRSEARTNLILKYELPSVKEPHCREALEKLIEIAYTAYMELEKHPQCRDYLYNFAAHQPEDRPTGHLDQGPDLKSLIASILDQVDKHKPHLDITPESDRYGDMPVTHPIGDKPSPEYNIPQIHEYNIPQQPQIIEYDIPQKPQIVEYNIPQKPQIVEYNIPQKPQIVEYNIPQKPQIVEYNIPQKPQIVEYNIPQKPQIVEYNIQKKISMPEVPEYNVPQIQEYNINEYNVPQPQEFIKPEFTLPKVHEYNVPKVPEYNINEYNAPKVHEYSITQNHEYNVPQMNEFSITQSQEYNVPKVHEYSITQEYNTPQVHEYNVPQINEYSITQSQEYNVPKVHEYSITQEYNTPKVHEYSITQNHEYNVPKVHEYHITQSHEYNIPQIQDIIIPQTQSIDMPEIHETIHETIEEVIPMQPEETINILIKLLQKSDQFDVGNLFDRLMNIVEENQNNFHPRIFKLLLTLLSAHKQNNIPRFNDIFLMLLDSQRNRDWPWSDRVTEHLLSHLIPDHTGNLDSRIVDIILNLYKNRPNEKQIEYILSLLRPFKEGNLDANIGDLILKLIHLHQNNLLRPDYVDILLKLLKPNHNNPIEVDIIDNLSRWNEMGISPNQLNGLFELLKPYVNGHTDRRPIDIIHFLLTQSRHLNPKHFDFILSFLYPENGILDNRRIDIIHFLLNNVSRYPKHANILLNLLQENAPGVLNSSFLDILLFLNSNRLLTPELIETLINLLTNDVTGQLEENQVKNLFFQLAPFKQSNPKLVVDILTLLNQGGLHGNIVEWLETTNNNIGLPNRDSKPANLVHEEVNQGNTNEYRTPDGGYQTVDGGQQTPDDDFMSIFKWLDSQGLITPDQGSNTDLVNKILHILQVGQRELGVVELTYMLKHEKPLIYQPVYYVKYRLPILSFISNMKSLLLENPNLNTDPMKLLQELIVISNVTEVSPNLQGYPKEEILKLTFNDGDLVQAKILDEQNLSLNDQITYVHGLNSDISPEEILQLNRMNEAKYFPKLLEVKGVHPNQLTIKEVDKFIDVPPIHYRHIEMNPGITHTTKTIHQTYISRGNQKQDPLHNAQLMPQ